METERNPADPAEYREPLGDRHSILLRRDALPLGTDALLLAGMLPYRPDDTALEIGAGTGAVSVLSALRGKFSRIDAVEIDPVLAALARRNVEDNRLSEVLHILQADARTLPVTHAYHAVFMNPPYRAAGSGRPCRFHLADISRYERAGTIAQLCRAASDSLRKDGRLYVVYPAARLSALLSAFREAELSLRRLTQVSAFPDAPPALCLCTAAPGISDGGKAPAARITPPLFLHEKRGDKEDSPAARTLYLTGSLPGEWSRYD